MIFPSRRVTVRICVLRSGQVDPDRLVLRVVLHDLRAACAAQPRGLVATERGGRVEHGVGVDPYRPRAQGASHAMGSLEIERVDPARKPMTEGYAGVFVVDDVGGIAAVEYPEDCGPTGDRCRADAAPGQVRRV